MKTIQTPTDTDLAVAARVLALADDELILAHRDSEWTGHAPILEEDIGLANIAQDELGHAGLWYGVYASLTGQDPDRMVFFREANGWRCVQLVELPKGDWAFTMLRQYLFDAYEHVLLGRLAESLHEGVASAAAKIRREELYHFRHTSAWVKRLGLGTRESHNRTQDALDALWPYTAQLFATAGGDEDLAALGYAPPPAELADGWNALVRPHLEASSLGVPDGPGLALPREQHTPYLAGLLIEMQRVARLDPEAVW
ncbi:MAG TPA: 1,2-phenylacetyl-CoA epoxidase subunit PaaC [bacterium]|nr:1,2-phenylacetyl-CoA epoxidase subunit PaaC [bacterium]